MRRLLSALLIACSGFATSALAITAEQLATREGEVAFGQAWLRNTRGALGERIDPFCVDVLETWLTRLRNHYPLGTMPLTGLCLNAPIFNAFAAPGGIIGVNRGIYLDLTTESEVMAVLAHELAHLSQRHHYRGLKNSERVSPGTLATLAGVVAAIATRQGQAAQSLIMGGQAANASQALAYSRDYEREADRIGVTALDAAGYDPNAMASVLQVLADKQSSMTRELAFLSTHPLGIERQSDLESRLDQLPLDTPRPPVLSSQDFALFRCVQVEGLDLSFAQAAGFDCAAIHDLMQDYRNDQYQAAWQAWQKQPSQIQNTLTGLDLTIAFAIKAGAFEVARDAIETLAVLFPSWVTPTVARLDLALAAGATKLPRAFREHTVERPERLELWRALARFAEATRQQHYLFEARAWDALMHGKLEASRTQLTRARDQWPESLDSRPLERLEVALSALERD